LAVKAGQYVRLWVTANVARGALPPGAFSGTAVLSGKSLLGNIVVQPPSVVPGGPVFVQVLDAAGKPFSDAGITVTLQGTTLSRGSEPRRNGNSAPNCNSVRYCGRTIAQ
jgi:hypothetical protein